MHDARARQRRFRAGARRRRRDQGLDQLVAEPDDPVLGHVAADHAFGQAGLERLVDHASLAGEVGLATPHDLAQAQMLYLAASARVQHLDPRVGVRRTIVVDELHLPDPQPAVTPVLFQHARPRGGQPGGEPSPELFDRGIEVGVDAPAKVPGPVQDLLHPHLEDQVRVGADPDAPRRHLPQQSVQPRSVTLVRDRIDPHQHAVLAQELVADLLDHLFREDRRFGDHAKIGQSLEDRAEAVVVDGRGRAGLAVAAPEQRYPDGS